MEQGKTSSSSLSSTESEAAINNFKSFVQIASISQTGVASGSYAKAAEFLRRLLENELSLPTQVISPVEGKPIVIASWVGSEPSLPSILLNSHYDVVPVIESMWEEEPFGAVERENGDIYGRGTQDMKCVCIQYIEAIRHLKSTQNVTFRRTIHLSFVPDEEIGGADGMGTLVNSDVFKALNVGVALDEGLASESETYALFHGERTMWRCRVIATGPTGHGSRFVKDTAMQKLINSVNQFLAYRAEQEAIFEGECGCQHAVAKKKKLGDVVTLNLTLLKGGVTLDGGKTYALNVIPSEAEAGFDIRIPPSVPLAEFDAKLKEWTKEDGVMYDFYYKDDIHTVTSIERSENAWWGVLSDAFSALDIKVEPEIFPAGTDSRFLRHIGIPAFGFSPMNNTKVLLHDHNERLNKKVFLRGIEIYTSIVSALANSTA